MPSSIPEAWVGREDQRPGRRDSSLRQARRDSALVLCANRNRVRYSDTVA